MSIHLFENQFVAKQHDFTSSCHFPPQKRSGIRFWILWLTWHLTHLLKLNPKIDVSLSDRRRSKAYSKTDKEFPESTYKRRLYHWKMVWDFISQQEADTYTICRKVLMKFLEDKDGPVKSIKIECLMPKIGSGDNLKSTPKRLPQILVNSH